jgi:hypothetical protein
MSAPLWSSLRLTLLILIIEPLQTSIAQAASYETYLRQELPIMAGATLEQSIKTYEIDTNIKLGDEFAAKNFPNDLAKFKEAVSKTSAKFHQQQGGSTWPTLARILKAFQTLGTLTSSAVSVTPFAPAALILGATLHLVHVTSQMIEAYSSIGDILAKIAGITDRLKIHSEAKVMRGELKSLIRRMLGVIVEVLGLASKLISKKRRKRDITKEYFQRLLFDEKSPLVTKMAALDGLATEENALVLALAGNGIQRIEGTMDQRHLETRLEKILQDELWTSMKQLHDKYTNSSKDGINADWIVDEPEVQQWMSVQAEKSKSALIWITAEQGTGKSYTASHLIRELLKDKSFITTYFYVQGHEKREHLALSILACIALQLINKSKPFKAIATKALSDTESGWTAETIWKKLFEPYMKRSHWMRIFIVIDGLDAADPREQDIILSKLKVLKDGKFAGGYQLHAAIFARPSLSSKYDIWTGSTFRIPEDKIRKGVADFIESKLSSLALFKKLSGAVQSQKIRQLKENIQTDFSLAALVIAQAQAYSRFNDLTMFLDRPISPDIEIHVRDILNQVSSDIYQKRHWLATLRWIACAYRNLTVNEVLFIRNADLDDDNLPLPKVVSSDDLKAENQSILTFPTHSSVSQTESSLVEIKNGIVRDYLAKDGKRMLRDLDVGYAIDNNAHAAIAEVCLRRLLRNEGKIPSATKPDIMAYAADYVIEHFRAVKKDDGILEPGKKRQLAHQMRQLLGDPSAIQRWYNSVSKGKLLEIIRLLLNDDEVLERIKQWTPELTLSGQPLSGHDLYTPFAQLCNKAWIEGANMDTQFCLLFLHHYNCLVSLDFSAVQNTQDSPDTAEILRCCSLLLLLFDEL